MTETEQTSLNSPVKIGMAIFILALTLRVAYVFTLEIDAPIRADAAKYVTIAHNLLTYGVYSHESSSNPEPNSFITPGYPFFLTAILAITTNINTTYIVSLGIQAILGALTVILTYMLALRILPLWASAVAGLLASISPHLIVASGYLLTEALFSFFLVLSVFLFTVALTLHKPSYKLFFALGILACCAALVRPVAQLLPPIFILVILISKPAGTKHVKACLALILGFAVLWSPWKLWSDNHPAVTSNFNAVFAFGIYPDFTFKNKNLRGYPNRDDPEFNKLNKSPVYALNVLLDRASNEPLKYIKWYFIGKPASYWGWSMIQGIGGPFIYPVKKSLYDKSSFVYFTKELMRKLHYFLVISMFAGFVYSFICMIKEKTPLIFGNNFLVIFLLLVSTTIVHSVLTSLPRYSIPFQYFMYIAAVFYLYHLFSYLKNQGFSRKMFMSFKLEKVGKSKEVI